MLNEIGFKRSGNPVDSYRTGDGRKHMESDNQREEPRPIRRRAFLGRVAKKAVYVAPAVMVLKAATEAHAGISGCGQAQSPCATDADCCPAFVCNVMGVPCAGEPDCECDDP